MKHLKRPVAELQPNKFNAQLFPDSLPKTAEDGSIDYAPVAALAESIAEHGQQVPIKCTPSGVIIDGERRYHALRKIKKATALCAVVDQEPTDDELLDAVLDHCTSQRSMSLREQVLIYEALTKRLQSGQRPIGKEKAPLEDLKAIAAKKAGLSSWRTAERAKAVLESTETDLQEKLLAGELSIAAAEKQLQERKPEPKKQRKKPKKKAKAKTTEPEATQATTSDVTANPFEADPQVETANSSQPEEPDPQEEDVSEEDLLEERAVQGLEAITKYMLSLGYGFALEYHDQLAEHLITTLRSLAPDDDDSSPDFDADDEDVDSILGTPSKPAKKKGEDEFEDDDEIAALLANV